MADINDVLIQMNDGFTNLHRKFDTKIDELRDDFNEHRVPCVKKFHDLELSLAVRNAKNGAVKEEHAKTRDFWKYIIRGSVMIGVAGLMAILWKLFIANIKIIGG